MPGPGRERFEPCAAGSSTLLLVGSSPMNTYSLRYYQQRQEFLASRCLVRTLCSAPSTARGLSGIFSRLARHWWRGRLFDDSGWSACPRTWISMAEHIPARCSKPFMPATTRPMVARLPLDSEGGPSSPSLGSPVQPRCLRIRAHRRCLHDVRTARSSSVAAHPGTLDPPTPQLAPIANGAYWLAMPLSGWRRRGHHRAFGMLETTVTT